MKKLAILALLGLGMWLSSCASNTVAPAPSTGAGGNWEARLVGGVGPASLLDFVSNFSVGGGGGGLTINSFSFFNSNASSCFLTVSGESGNAMLNTTASGQVTGTLSYTVTSASPAGSTLSLTSYQNGLTGTSTGTSGNTALRNGVVLGTWTLSSSTDTTGCSGTGTFVLCQEAVPNSSGGCGTANAAREPEE